MDNFAAEKIDDFKKKLTVPTDENSLLNTEMYTVPDEDLNPDNPESNVELDFGNNPGKPQYLVIGCVDWYNIDEIDTVYHAPLLFIPLKYDKQGKASYDIGDVNDNIYLHLMLEKYGIELPVFNNKKDNIQDYLGKIDNTLNDTPFEFISKLYTSSFNADNTEAVRELLTIKSYDDYKFYGLNRIINRDSFNITPAEEYQSIDDYSVYNLNINLTDNINNDKSILVDYDDRDTLNELIINLISQIIANHEKVLLVTESRQLIKQIHENSLDELVLNLDNSSFKEDILNTINAPTYIITDKSIYAELDTINNQIKLMDEALNDVKQTTGNDYSYYTEELEKLEQELGKTVDLNLDVSNLNEYKVKHITHNLKNVVEAYRKTAPVKDKKLDGFNEENTVNLDIGSLRNTMETIKDNYTQLMENIEELSSMTGTQVDENISFAELMDKYKCITPNVKYHKYISQIEKLDSILQIIQLYSKDVGPALMTDLLDEEMMELETYMHKRKYSDIDYKLIERKDIKELFNTLLTTNNIINDSAMSKLVYDPGLKEKLDYYRKKSHIPGIKIFDTKYDNIQKEFTSYYNTKVEADEIIHDIETLLNNKQLLDEIIETVQPYTKRQMNTDEIIRTIYDLLENEENIRQVTQKIGEKLGRNLTPSDITEQIIKRNILKQLLEDLDEYNEIGEIILKDKWMSYKTDTGYIQQIYDDISRYDKEVKNGFYNDKTTEKLENINYNKYNELINNSLTLYENIDTLTYKLLGKLEIHNKQPETIKDVKEFISRTGKIEQNIDNLIKLKLFYRYIYDNENKYTHQLLENIKQDKIEADNIINTFKYNYIKQVIKQVQEKHPILLDIHDYRKLTDKQNMIQQQILKLNNIRLKEQHAKQRNIKTLQEYGNEYKKLQNILLQKQVTGNDLTQIKDIITQIKPCTIIKPEDITIKLPLDEYDSYYDYIILDEVNKIQQIPAILRTRNIIITTDNTNTIIEQTGKNTYHLNKTDKTPVNVNIEDKYTQIKTTQFTPKPQKITVKEENKPQKLNKKEQASKQKEQELKQREIDLNQFENEIKIKRSLMKRQAEEQKERKKTLDEQEKQIRIDKGKLTQLQEEVNNAQRENRKLHEQLEERKKHQDEQYLKNEERTKEYLLKKRELKEREEKLDKESQDLKHARDREKDEQIRFLQGEVKRLKRVVHNLTDNDGYYAWLDDEETFY